jgi:nitroreductase/NAD-dependent dihydropyrimidine dehydrogenase PreA subunit
MEIDLNFLHEKENSMLDHRPILTEKPVGIAINKDKCQDCNRCLDACPLTQCLGFKTLEEQALRQLCIQCGTCMAICPRQAISIDGLVAPSPIAPLPSSHEVLNLIKQRRSVRAFTSQPVEPEAWEKLLEAVKYSPTGHHVQQIDIMIIQSREVLSKLVQVGMELFKMLSGRINKPVFSSFYKRMLGEHTYSVFSKSSRFYDQQVEMIAQGEDPVLFNAPAIMLFLGPKSELMAKTEADLAAQTVALYAPTLGLATCYSGIVSASFSGMYPAIKKVVKLPAGYVVQNALIVGHPKYKITSIPYRRDRNIYYV